MKKEGQASEIKVCYTCGHSGFADYISTCSLCKVTYEHTYCMRTLGYQIPEKWHCEECLGSAEVVSKKHFPASQFLHKTISRKIEAGKVKFITNEEVVTLASWNRLHGKGNRTVSLHRAGYKRSPVSWKVTPILSSSKSLKATFRPKKAPVHTGADISFSEHSIASKHVNKDKVSRIAEDHRRIPAEGFKEPLNRKYDLSIKELKNAALVVKEDRDFPDERDTNVLPVNDSGSGLRSTSQSSKFSTPEMLLPLNLAVCSDEKLHLIPEPCWRGAFEVLDSVTQFSGSILAHLPCQVSSKVFEISKQMPRILVCKVLSRESVWPKIFKLDPPTKDDVALYFKCEVGWHKETYHRFVQRVHSHDYALQSVIDDTELLLFTSAQLPTNCQKFGGHINLWGVFRHVKQKKSSHREEKAASLGIPSNRLPDSLKAEITDVPTKLEDALPLFSRPNYKSPVEVKAMKAAEAHLLDFPPGFPCHKRPSPKPSAKPTKGSSTH